MSVTFKHWLRCYGDVIGPPPSAQFGSDLRASVESTLGGRLPDASTWQCGIGAKTVGLGLRNARDAALPAFIGSRINSSPMLGSMFDHFESAGLGLASDLAAAYDGRTDMVIASVCDEVPSGTRGSIRDLLTAGCSVALASSSKRACGVRRC